MKGKVNPEAVKSGIEYMIEFSSGIVNNLRL